MNSLAALPNPTPSTSLPEKWVDRLLERMALLYGKKFTEQWASLDPHALRRCWAEELAGYSGDEIRRGLDACKARQWPPTLPEFLQLCRPSVDPETAFHEAVKGLAERKAGNIGVWSHPAIFWAAQAVGPFDILNNGYPVMRTRWSRELADQYAHEQWATVPDPTLSLPAPGKTETTKESAAQRRGELKATGVLKGPEKGNTAWATRIIERHEAGDAALSNAALQMAREALGIRDAA